jgi:hypothetical protein
MEMVEARRFTGFDVLEEAEGRVWRGKGGAGEKKSRTCGSKSSEWMYTEPYREPQNGNPG